MSATDTKLGGIHELVADTIAFSLQPVVDEDGKKHPPAAAYIAAAIKFLKDNNVEAARDSAKLKNLSSLLDNLPFSSADDLGPTH